MVFFFFSRRYAPCVTLQLLLLSIPQLKFSQKPAKDLLTTWLCLKWFSNLSRGFFFFFFFLNQACVAFLRVPHGTLIWEWERIFFHFPYGSPFSTCCKTPNFCTLTRTVTFVGLLCGYCRRCRQNVSPHIFHALLLFAKQ